MVVSSMKSLIILLIGCSVALVYLSGTSRIATFAVSKQILDETQPEIFQPTKFGPLRRNKSSPSRYSVLALWESAENSLETCMDAVNTIFPHLQDTRCSDIDRGFVLLRRCT
jgi:hypothetical protein